MVKPSGFNLPKTVAFLLIFASVVFSGRYGIRKFRAYRGASGQITSPPPPPPVNDPLLHVFVSGLENPSNISVAHDGSNRIVVLEHFKGRARLIENGKLLTQPILDVRSLTFPTGKGFYGLVGFAFPPNFSDSHEIYASYAVAQGLDDEKLGRLVISRFKVSSDTGMAELSTEKRLFEYKLDDYHCGHLAFSPKDGYLYACAGLGIIDYSKSEYARAQDLTTIKGKMLRVDVVNRAPDQAYRIPDDNPFAGSSSAKAEIWAYGLRNPWRFSFDSKTGDLYIPDVGSTLAQNSNASEEISFAPSTSRGGVNYGFPYSEGSICVKGDEEDCKKNISWPVYAYRHADKIGTCVIGGTVYRGKEFPEWDGVYIYGDFMVGTLSGLKRVNGKWFTAQITATNMHPSAIESGPTGDILIADYPRGTIFRMDLPKINTLKWKPAASGLQISAPNL